MTLEEARRRADETLRRFGGDAVPLALAPDEVVADIGWAFVFPWNSARWFATRDPLDAAGPSAGPVVVLKRERRAFMLDSAPSIDAQLRNLAEAEGHPIPSPLGW